MSGRELARLLSLLFPMAGSGGGNGMEDANARFEGRRERERHS